MVEFTLVATDTVRRTQDTNRSFAISLSTGTAVLLLACCVVAALV